ncbi:glycogen synthase GlgA [Solimonas flava]|uniref:glycogen synthase GlgA n=1 Tax=Solimonas flava TaxID=415849 RepID=UPI0003F87623|nr:glycogen synthase GlgA [Solimonas flava]
MNVLHAASECFPLVKTGGLADVIGALPPALRALGCDARVVLPGYRGLRERLAPVRTLGTLSAHGRELQLLRGTLGELPVYLVADAGLYERDGDPYRDAGGAEFADNALRFACFAQAVAALGRGFDADYVPDVVNLHDWQAALAAPWLRSASPRPALVYTIHNLAYQGQFERAQYEALGLPDAWWTPDGLEFWGRWSCMKAGIVYSDAISTVSPSYAREIQTPEYGHGLDGVLRWRAAALHGIANGIDTAVWDPRRDPLIERHYGVDDVAPGKAANKYLLQTELGLASGDWPLVVFIGRLAEQKGADLIVAAQDELLQLPAQYALLASGDAELQRRLQDFAARAPAGRVALRIAHDERFAHRLNAAADLVLMPSRFEPCGLNQMYAQRYGAIPVVRRTGGLIDTVVDADAASLADGSASGVLFNDADADGLLYGVRRALQLYEQADTRARLRRAGMTRDFSWSASAQSYLALYRGLAAAGDTTR